MSRPNSEQLEYLQKQAIIQSLKKELYQLKDREHDFIPLQNEVTNVESKYELLQAQKQRIESQNKIKLEINKKNILELRTESDCLKMQNHKASVQIEEILRDIANLKRTCESRQSEIGALIAANQEMNSKNEQLDQDNRNASNRTKNIKEERNMMDKESERLLKAVEDNLNLVKNLQKEARTFQASNNKLKSILAVAQTDNLELIHQTRAREQIMGATYKKLDNLNQQIQNLREKTNKLNKQVNKGQQDYLSVVQNLELLSNKNKEQGKKIKILENELRLIQNDYDAAILERDALYNDHQNFSHQNKLLNDQIDKILMSIMQAQRENIELNKQLQNYITLDEEARKLLNRKETTLGLMDSVGKRLAHTGQNISHLR